MKKTVFLSIALFGSLCTFAQTEVDYNTIILPTNASNLSFEEKLVQLAWRNDPNNSQVIKQSSVARYTLKQAQWTWLDYITVRGNLNEFTLNPSRDVNDRANFYPRYNFGIAITL